MERANESRVTDMGWRGFSTELTVFDKVPWQRCFHRKPKTQFYFVISGVKAVEQPHGT